MTKIELLNSILLLARLLMAYICAYYIGSARQYIIFSKEAVKFDDIRMYKLLYPGAFFLVAILDSFLLF